MLEVGDSSNGLWARPFAFCEAARSYLKSRHESSFSRVNVCNERVSSSMTNSFVSVKRDLHLCLRRI